MKKKRVQFEATPERLEELDELQRRLRLNSRTELLNTALTLLEWAADQVAEGRGLASIDRDGGVYREMVMPALKHATRRERV